MKQLFLYSLIFFCANNNAQVTTPLPTKSQLDWHEMEFYLFTHFGPNTFTDKEWGHGDEPEDIFNPTQLDCKQWCRIAKAAGAKGIIITAKHHDGFCLWPSKYSTHTVRESKWKEGKGDVLKELSEACRESGLKFGVYISPWDRNHPKYGTPEYNDVFVNMMEEIFSNYGPIWELWWDGANGEGPNGKKQVYDWDRFKKTVASISPNTVIFSDVGPHIRWVGNEQGIAGRINWNTLDTAGFTPGAGAPPTDTLTTGNVNGKNWIPAECDVSIRPGWFYHKEEDNKVKTPEQLFNLYLKSVGRGANLLLNVPPDRRGLIHENDSAALVSFKQLRDNSFKKDLAAHSKIPPLKPESKLSSVFKFQNFYMTRVVFTFKQKINCIVLKENIEEGQAIETFNIETGKKTVLGETIGHKRIITFPATDVKEIYIYCGTGKARKPGKLEVEAYLLDEKLVEK